MQGKPYDNYRISPQSVNKKESCEAPFLRKTMFEHIIWLSNFISDTPWTSVLTLHSSTQNQRQGWYWLTSKIGIVQKYPLLEWAVSISKMQSSFPSRGEVKSKLWKTPFWRFIINCIHLSFIWYSFSFNSWISCENTNGTQLKVRQSCNVFFKPTILPKSERTNSSFFCLTVLWSNCFVHFLTYKVCVGGWCMPIFPRFYAHFM